MTITAKFASVCPCCSMRIQPGAKVEWSKGSPAKHVKCPSAGSAPVAATASTEARVSVAGNTYPVRNQLASLGGRWDAAAQAWTVPASKADEARAIVVAAGPRAPRKASSGRRGFVPCGYPGCNSYHCDECGGEGRYSDTCRRGYGA